MHAAKLARWFHNDLKRPAVLSLLLLALLPGQLDVDVDADLLQLDLLHPSLARHRRHHFRHWLANLGSGESGGIKSELM